MQAPFCVVDAFTRKRYGGNPAAVVALPDWDGKKEWPPEMWMQAVATEFNLSETAYVRMAPGEDPARYGLRWFTPVREVPLCGHATLAAAHAIATHFSRSGATEQRFLTFETASGELTARRSEDGCWWLDFPISLAGRDDPPADLIEAVKPQPEAWHRTDQKDWIAVYTRAEDVAKLQPHLGRLRMVDMRGLCVTAPGDWNSGVDFVSRFFAPGYGIDEDPVTGSAHCSLTPYWARRLGKPKLKARQISKRGGELQVEDMGDRVLIGGHCVLTSSGELQ